MEDTTKKCTTLGQRIKACTRKNSVVYWIPVDIWKDFLNRHVDAKSLTRLAQTCSPFAEFIRYICENNVRIAWECRRENQIPLAKKWLLSCAENGSPEAMFHLGYAITTGGGWGFEEDRKSSNGFDWLKKAANHGSVVAMAFYIHYNLTKKKTNKAREEIILSSGDSLAIGILFQWSFGNKQRQEEAIHYFRKSAEEDNNEYGQYYLAHCLDCGPGFIFGYKRSRMELHIEAASQGFGQSQRESAKICLALYKGFGPMSGDAKEIAERNNKLADMQCTK